MESFRSSSRTSTRLFGMAAILIFAANFIACTKKPEKELAVSKVVNLAIWSNYVSPALLQEFEKRTGVHVQVSNYSSNEELLAKLQAGAGGYDVAVPSDYAVFAMIKLGLLRELDYSKLPNTKALDPRYLKLPFDPTNRFSLPYDWGTTGIAVNRALYQGEIKGWNDLFTRPDLAGKYSLLDDVRETIGAALKAQGFSLNATKPEELKKAKDLLLKTRGRVRAFTSEPLMALVNGEVPVAHAYMSDALQARKKTGGKIDYILPEEGSTLWVDNLVIPVGAQHVEESHELINFLLDAHTSLSTVTQLFVAPANKETVALLPKDLRKNRMLFPPEALLSKCEMLKDLGESLQLWDRIWTEVKAKSE